MYFPNKVTRVKPTRFQLGLGFIFGLGVDSVLLTLQLRTGLGGGKLNQKRL